MPFSASSTPLYYAGIGSRRTPDGVLEKMVGIGKWLGKRGVVLRSGGADGADSAFEAGCDAVHGPKQIFLPWDNFGGRRKGERGVYAGVGPNALVLAEKMHPNWAACSRGARALHARNCYQILGPRLDTPVDFLICWTEGGKGGGGTGQALRIARMHGIKVFDFGGESSLNPEELMSVAGFATGEEENARNS